MSASLRPVVAKLEDLFDCFNEHYYNNELQRPVITVSPDMTGGAYGWCTAYKAWEHEGTDGYYEINITAEYLNRPFQETCATMLHEMVHLWNLQNDIKDTSRGNAYHNKKFKEEAEKRGLSIEHHQTYGWTITNLSEEGKEFIKTIDIDSFPLHRTPLFKVIITKDEDGNEVTTKVKVKGKGRAGTKQSSRKYVCPSCGTIIRATKEVNVICGDCNVQMEREG